MKSQDVSGFIAGGGDLAELIRGAEPLPTPPPPPGALFVRGASTWEMTERGERCVAPYRLRFLRDVSTPTGHSLEGVIEVECAKDRRFSMSAELLGDPHALKKMLAGQLGTHFRTPQQRLERLVDAWLEASTIEHRRIVQDFGFTDEGRRFIDRGGTLPDGQDCFGPPADATGARLGLREGDGVEVMRALLALWPQVVGSPTLVATLLGLVGWGLVAPVLEARDAGVAPLLALLNGPTGAGKSTQAGVVQCFFGDFVGTLSAVSFSSTPLSIELESHLFRGAVMVVGDVKLCGVAEGGLARVLGLVQRAGDRAERRRLDNQGQALHARRSRATWLFEGEDVPVSEGSALARLLILQLPEAPRAPVLVSQLHALMPRLPEATHALVKHLLATQPWEALLGRYHAHARLLTTAANGAQNAVRLAKSIAAVAVGLEVWTVYLRSVGLEPPAGVDALVDALLGPCSAQLSDLAQATPGERFLELVRQLLACGAAHLGEQEQVGEGIGLWKEDGRVAYLLPEVTLGRIRRHLPDAAAGLAPQASIAADLLRSGAILERDADRRTKKVRVGGRAVNTWAIEASRVRG